MPENNLTRNLKDAGCSSKTIAQFMDFYQAQSVVEQKRVLAVHRTSLLEAIHKSQKKLDCLDYLIYRLNLNNHKK